VSNGTRWVGIDLHRKRSHIAVIDEQGELTLSRRIVNDRDTFLELLGDPGAGAHVALEATYGWEWLAELLEEAGYDLHLAHPLRTRAIAAARVKTDAIDAKTLAHLLRTGFLPEAYVAPRELRDLRELLRHRATLTRMRSAVKNRVHAILAKHGIANEHSDLFGKGGREFLEQLELRDAPRRRLDSLMSLICDFDREIETTTREIEERAKADDRVEVLTQIRGVGRYTAMLIIAEIGDITRFPTARHLVLLGRTGAERPLIGRQSTPRAHHPPGIARAALGAGRGRAEDHHRVRPATREVRADLQTPRAQDREGRCRPRDPDPVLLRLRDGEIRCLVVLCYVTGIGVEIH
jgi:transposase